MDKKIAFVSDFDGTITDDDFFNYVVDSYLDDKSLEPWREYMAGEKTHFNALREIFLNVKVDEKELKQLISKIKIDEHTKKVWDLCNQKSIPMYICSAGNDYYIKELIGNDLLNHHIELITNSSNYDEKTGLDMFPLPKSSPFYDENIGISKSKIIQKLKDEGYFVIFAGDGPPDVAPAILSDVVFARKFLLKECNKQGIKVENFDSYENIYNYIKDL